jgi:homoserine dehydrogenase
MRSSPRGEYGSGPDLPSWSGAFSIEDQDMTSVAEARPGTADAWTTAPAVRVALAGCGAVGSALLRQIEVRRVSLERRHGHRLELTRVLVRDVSKRRGVDVDSALLTASVDDFLTVDADVVIEAIGGIEPARRIAEWALMHGRELVTANKELLAAHGARLHEIACRHGGILRYDAAVGGGVPVLRLLDDALGAGTPGCVRGILNGTTNYVLGRLERGDSLDAALRAARAAGFSEEDASRDLDGRDAAAKIALVAWAAYGVAPEAVTVARRTLLPDPARYVRLAARHGGVVRQVAECALVSDGVSAVVEPVIVARDSAFGRARDEQNHVEVHTGWSAPLSASGPGAGGAPTATALLADFISTSRAPERRVGVRGVRVDDRPWRWAIEVDGPPRLLHRHVDGCGLVQTDDHATFAWTVARGLTRDQVESLLATLRAQGADAIAARLDDEQPGDRENAL